MTEDTKDTLMWIGLIVITLGVVVFEATFNHSRVIFL